MFHSKWLLLVSRSSLFFNLLCCVAFANKASAELPGDLPAFMESPVAIATEPETSPTPSPPASFNSPFAIAPELQPSPTASPLAYSTSLPVTAPDYDPSPIPSPHELLEVMTTDEMTDASEEEPTPFESFRQRIADSSDSSFLQEVANRNYFLEEETGFDLDEQAILQEDALERLAAYAPGVLFDAVLGQANGIPADLAAGKLRESEAGFNFLIRVIENPEAVYGDLARQTAIQAVASPNAPYDSEEQQGISQALLPLIDHPNISLRLAALGALTSLAQRMADIPVRNEICRVLWNTFFVETNALSIPRLVEALAAYSPPDYLGQFIQMVENPENSQAAVAALTAIRTHADLILQSSSEEPNSLRNLIVPELIRLRDLATSSVVRVQIRAVLAHLGARAIALAGLPSYINCGPALDGEVNQAHLRFGAELIAAAFSGPALSPSIIQLELHPVRRQLACAILQTTTPEAACTFLLHFETMELRPAISNAHQDPPDTWFRETFAPTARTLIQFQQHRFTSPSVAVSGFRDANGRLLNELLQQLNTLDLTQFTSQSTLAIRNDLIWEIDGILNPIVELPQSPPLMAPQTDILPEIPPNQEE